MQTMLAEVDEVANAAGLYSNPRKSASLHVDCRGASQVVDTLFVVGGEPIGAFREEDTYPYPGILVGFQAD